jgi:hypothetical protein
MEKYEIEKIYSDKNNNKNKNNNNDNSNNNIETKEIIIFSEI